MSISNNYGDSSFYNRGISFLALGAAAPKLSPELSGYIESLYLILDGSMGQVKNTGTATPSQNFELQQFAGLVNNPQFLADLTAAAKAGSKEAGNLYSAFTAKDISGNSILDYCSHINTDPSALSALQDMISDQSSGSLINSIGTIVGSNFTWTSLQYTPPTTSDPSTSVAGLPSALQNLLSDMETLASFIPSNMNRAETFAGLLSGDLKAVDSILSAPENKNDPFCVMINNFLNSNYGSSTVSFSGLISEITAAGGDKTKLDAILYNPKNPTDPTTLYNFWNNKGTNTAPMDNNFSYYFGIVIGKLANYISSGS